MTVENEMKYKLRKEFEKFCDEELSDVEVKTIETNVDFVLSFYKPEESADTTLIKQCEENARYNIVLALYYDDDEFLDDLDDDTLDEEVWELCEMIESVNNSRGNDE